MRFLLDTCALVFLATEPEKIEEATRATLDHGDSELLILAASAWEICCASRRGRVRCDRPWAKWFRRHCAALECRILPVTMEMVESADLLPEPFYNDPVDRLIVGQARRDGMIVITTDRKILDYPHVQSLR